MSEKDSRTDFTTWWTKEMGGEFFSPNFNKNLQAVMADRRQPIVVRVYAWLVFNSWGQYKTFVCRLTKGAGARWVPATQGDCAIDLGLSGQQVSAAAALFEERGILKRRGNVMILDHLAKPIVTKEEQEDGESKTIPETRSGWYKRVLFAKQYPTEFKEWQRIEEKRQPFLNLFLSGFKAWNKQGCPGWKEGEAKEKESPEMSEAAENSFRRTSVKNSGVRQKSTGSGPLSNKDKCPPNPLNPVKGAVSSGVHANGETTTTVKNRASSSSSPISSPRKNPGAPPPEFSNRLATSFLQAHKPVPTDDQTAVAFHLLGSHWEDFLVWLPASKPFRKTEHGGSLPALIKFFEASRSAADAQGKPVQQQEMTRQEVESYWRERWSAATPQERADIERIVSDINFKTRGAA